MTELVGRLVPENHWDTAKWLHRDKLLGWEGNRCKDVTGSQSAVTITREATVKGKYNLSSFFAMQTNFSSLKIDEASNITQISLITIKNATK